MAKKKMGRPALKKSVKRDLRVAVVVNREEMDLILAAAKAAGDTASVWGRKRLLEAVRAKA